MKIYNLPHILPHRFPPRTSANPHGYDVCCNCGGPRLEHSIRCLECWFKYMSNRHFDTEEKSIELKDLIESQQYICPYTKNLLVPGENASIDHKIPLSRGGINDIANMHWVDVGANGKKQSKTHEEYLRIIKL